MVDAVVPVTVTEAGESSALPAVTQVDEKFTVTGADDDAPLTSTVMTEAPDEEMLAGAAVTAFRLTFVADTEKTVCADSAVVLLAGVKLATTMSAPILPATG